MDSSVEIQPLSDEPAQQEPEQPSRRLFWLRMLAFFVVPSLFIAFLTVGLLRSSPPELAGKSAPEFELPVLGSKQMLSSADLKGSPVVINFWASWCTPCKEEAPTLEEKWRKYRGGGVRFVGVNVQDLERDATAFVEEFGITFPSVRDTELNLWNQFGVRGLPETFFIDHQWKFVSVEGGEEIGNRGATKILGAIPPGVLETQIQRLLEREKGASAWAS